MNKTDVTDPYTQGWRKCVRLAAAMYSRMLWILLRYYQLNGGTTALKKLVADSEPLTREPFALFLACPLWYALSRGHGERQAKSGQTRCRFAAGGAPAVVRTLHGSGSSLLLLGEEFDYPTGCEPPGMEYTTAAQQCKSATSIEKTRVQPPEQQMIVDIAYICVHVYYTYTASKVQLQAPVAFLPAFFGCTWRNVTAGADTGFEHDATRR